MVLVLGVGLVQPRRPYETPVYLKRLDDAGVRFRSFTEPYLDTCGMFRDAVISILTTIAKQERLRIQDRSEQDWIELVRMGPEVGNLWVTPELFFVETKW